MANEEKGVTLGRLLKVAFGNLKVFIPVTILVTAGFALGIHYGLNTFRGSYSSTFSYSSSDLADEKYADGSDLYYRNLISYNNLTSIKNSNEKYASIDIERILDSNGIKIISNSEEKTYTVTLAYRYLKNQSVAKDFINDIAASALSKDADIVKNGNYDNSLKLFDDADTFEKQVNYLNSQAQYLTNQYKLLTTTSAESKVSLPTPVLEKIAANNQQILLVIPENFVESMNYRISQGGYVKDYNSQEAKSFDTKIVSLQEEHNLNDSKIAALRNEIKNIDADATTAISSLSEEVEKLILRNSDIEYEIDAINAKKANEGKPESEVPGLTQFKQDLVSYRSQLSLAVDAYKSVLQVAYIDGASVEFEDSSIIKLNGTVNVFVNIMISLVAGVAVGAVVDLIVDRKKLYE